MSVKPIGDLLMEMKKRYDKDQQGWRVLSGRADRGLYDTFILHRDRLWQMKTEPVNPFEVIGVGSVHRRVDESLHNRIMQEGKPFFFQIAAPQRKGVVLAQGIQRYSDDSTNRLRMVMSDRQETLDRELQTAVRSMSLKRFPERHALYG
ncbi:MAG: hypothetical protein ACFFBX_09510 [Promethearchaeota archaeon]